MIEIEVTSPHPEQALAELIASTLPGHPIEDPNSSVAKTGQLVRDQQVVAESQRPSWQQMETVNFTTIDDDDDWSEI